MASRIVNTMMEQVRRAKRLREGVHRLQDSPPNRPKATPECS